MAVSEKVHMLRCASYLVTAAYSKVRLIPQSLRALPLALFTKPLEFRPLGGGYQFIVIFSVFGI